MLPREHRLSSKRDITSALRRGRRRSSPHLIVHVANSPRPGPARAAFAVSSAVGNSVVRHRLTRQLRAALAPMLAQLPDGTDLVVRALPAAHGADYTDLVADLQRCLDLEHQPSGPPSPDRGASTPGGEDMEIIAAQEVLASQPGEPPTHGEFLETAAKSPRTGLARVLFVLGTPLRWLLIGLVTVYRQVISPVLPPTCRYHPSCSAYALESLQVHGAAKGVVLAGWRLGRCNPFTKGGLDPVPERGAWRPAIWPDGTPRDPGGVPSAASAVGLPHNPGALTPARTPEA